MGLAAKIKTPEEKVLALGDQALIEQHLTVESDLNHLLSLIELLEEKAEGFPSLSAEERSSFIEELPEVAARGDNLARGIGRRSAIEPAEIQRAREAWQQIRRRISALS